MNAFNELVNTIKAHALILTISCLTPVVSTAQFHVPDSPFITPIKAIKQDAQGLIWISSKEKVAYFDGYEFKEINFKPGKFDPSASISDIDFMNETTLVVATHNYGLLTYDLKHPDHLKPITEPNDQTFFSIESINEHIWAASTNGLYKTDGGTTSFFPFATQKQYISEIDHRSGQIVIASEKELLVFDMENRQFSELQYPDAERTSYIWDLYVDNKSNLYVSTDVGLFRNQNGEWKQLSYQDQRIVVSALMTDADQRWLGTTSNGLITQPKRSGRLNREFTVSNSNLSSDAITTLFSDQAGNTWVGAFDGSISIISRNSLAFGLNKNLHGLAECTDVGPDVAHFITDKQGDLWLLTSTDVVRLNSQGSTCQSLRLSKSSTVNLKDYIPRTIFRDASDHLWVNYYRLGFIRINDLGIADISTLRPLDDANRVLYHFITQADNSTFVFGTSRGVISYNIDTGQVGTHESEQAQFDNSIVYDSQPLPNSEWALATSSGVAIFNGESIRPYTRIQEQLPTNQTQAVYLDSKGRTWIGTADSGLFKFDQDKILVERFSSESFLGAMNISNILEDSSSHIWVSAESRLARISSGKNNIEVFDSADGLQSKNFNIGSGFQANDGTLYFGGFGGFNSFNPNDVVADPTPPAILLTQASRFNKPVEFGVNYDGFELKQGISHISNLGLSHKDYVMAFQFAALDFAAPEKNLYAYKLEGFDPDWNYVNASNRTVTYTDLPSGKYVLRIKGSNRYGIWNEVGKEIRLNVKPAPWLSWWARLSYVLLSVVTIYFFVRKKVRFSQRQAQQLALEVATKTEELRSQKQQIESLLIRKNELFSNVSHEFRTPLTLILGPLAELIGRVKDFEHINKLKVVQRNASRLLSLVEQLLELAKVTDVGKITRSTQETGSQVAAVVAAFEHMAQLNEIKLILTCNENCRIDVTENCLDAVLSNLISNAIKYTPPGGTVDIKASVDRQYFLLQIKDNGAGIPAEQKKVIFDRFTRLPAHHTTEGIGIGLAVVEETVQVNHGKVEVISEVGIGSEFRVSLPLSESLPAIHSDNCSSLTHQLASEPVKPHTSESPPNGSNSSRGRNLVLIIEDHSDMRNHIASILGIQYNTMTAENGREGILLAIEHVPDLVVCDVMMPELSGYDVSRTIRSDLRTCHIPIVLLTALADKASRIKGWREQVDAYLAKPFDQMELLAQLENILTVRDIVRKKVALSIDSTSKLGQQQVINELAKKDQEFVDKLMNLLNQCYPNPQVNLSFIADKMAVSERQLQRKLKAMIDKNPLEILREIRLERSSEFLKEGSQVSEVADLCGFSSVSYFSKCFKAQYNMSPKRYQQASI